MLKAFLCGLVVLTAVSATPVQVQAPRLVRSISGPSGKLVGEDFVIDAPRSRFVYPQDASVTVYFEWDFTPGDHELVATWIRPSGQVASVSPAVRIQTSTAALKSYWIFQITAGVESGAWTISVRIDGQPAGSHAFEIAGTGAGGRLTLDQVFKNYGPSVVKVFRLDADGRRIDSSMGFVVGPGAIATAFQSIDAASSIQVEFADGHRTTVASVTALGRLDDWAVLNVETAGLTPLPRGGPPPVGGRLAAFDVDGGTPVVVPLDVGSVAASGGRAARIKFSPALSPVAAGGPLVDESGQVVGIVGGSLTPGQRSAAAAEGRPVSVTTYGRQTTASVVASLPAVIPASSRGWTDVLHDQVLTPPIVVMQEFLYGGATSQLPKDASNHIIKDAREFSARDNAQVSVYSFWVKKAKLSKGELSAIVYDAENHVRSTIPPKKVSLGSDEQRFVVTFSPKSLEPGEYRVDTLWDGKPAWRTYIRVTD